MQHPAKRTKARSAGFFLQFPDIPVIFLNRPVGGEKACLADVSQHLLRPVLLILIIGKCLVFDRNIVFEIGEGHKPVFVEQLIVQTG